MKKIIVVLLIITLALIPIVGCSPPAGEPAAEEPAAEEPAADGEHDYVVGFANISEIGQVTITLGDRLEEECEKLGMKVLRVDNNFDGQKAVKNVDDLLTMGIDALIEFNVDESVAPVIMEKMGDIPVFAIDIPHPGATFFGADNAYAGEIAGDYLGQLIVDEWDGKIDALLLVDQMASGELPRQRIYGYIPGIQKHIPEFSEEQVYYVEGKQDAATAQQVVSDWLSAHPDMHNIAIGSLQDDGFRGACAAVEVAGREDDVLAVGQNEYFFLEYVQTHPEENFVRGAVCFFIEDYGKWIAPALREVLDGAPQPENVYVDHEVVTRDNINELFPDL